MGEVIIWTLAEFVSLVTYTKTQRASDFYGGFILMDRDKIMEWMESKVYDLWLFLRLKYMGF